MKYQRKITPAQRLIYRGVHGAVLNVINAHPQTMLREAA